MLDLMARLTTRARKNLSKSQFALPEKDGYPINDPAHARNALSRAAQHASPSERATIRAKVKRRYPSIKVGDEED